MSQVGAQSGAAALALAVLAGCADGAPTPPDAAVGAPVYRGIETLPLDESLVRFIVEMEGAGGADDVTAYADCAAAQYAVSRGDGFARHVRTRMAQEAGVWRADAVYTVSPALPEGLRTIDAEVAVADCNERGIPTV